jgi:hypothetical protein
MDKIKLKNIIKGVIKEALIEGMPNFKNPTKFETQNDTPEMTKVRKKLHPIQDRWDQFEKDVKANKFSPEKKKELRDKILDDQQAVFAELNKLAKEAKNKKEDEKKQKLSESTIREIIREVLAEEIGFKEGDKCLALVRGSAASGYEECTILGMDPSGVAVVQNEDGISDEVYTKDLRPIGSKVVNEEAYDTVRDVTQALNTSRPSQDAVEDYLGRSLSSDELRAFGFNSGIVTGYKYGQPQYAGQGQKKTYTKYARSNSRRSY